MKDCRPICTSLQGLAFPPAHHWDGSPGKVIRHSTRLATRPFGGAERPARAAARCAGGLGSGRLLEDQAEQRTRVAILQRVVRTRPFKSLGLRPAREVCCGSNNAATVFV
jgi:hypothetical protein